MSDIEILMSDIELCSRTDGCEWKSHVHCERDGESADDLGSAMSPRTPGHAIDDRKEGRQEGVSDAISHILSEL